MIFLSKSPRTKTELLLRVRVWEAPAPLSLSRAALLSFAFNLFILFFIIILK